MGNLRGAPHVLLFAALAVGCAGGKLKQGDGGRDTRAPDGQGGDGNKGDALGGGDGSAPDSGSGDAAGEAAGEAAPEPAPEPEIEPAPELPTMEPLPEPPPVDEPPELPEPPVVDPPVVDAPPDAAAEPSPEIGPPDVTIDTAPDAGAEAADGSDGSADDTADAPPIKVTVWANSPSSLYRINFAGGPPTADFIGAFGIPEQMLDIAIASDGRMYGATWTSGGSPYKLFSIDTGTGAATELAVLTIGPVNGLTFDKDGVLWAGTISGSLYTVDTVTGSPTFKGSLTGGVAGDILGVASGNIYATTQTGGGATMSNNGFVEFRVSDGMTIDHGLTGSPNMFGLATRCGKVYAFDEVGQILEVDPMTAVSTFLSSPGYMFWGGASNPLAAATDPGCP